MLRWLFRTSPFQTDLGLLGIRLFFGLTLALGHGLEKVSNFERFISQVDKIGLPFPQVLGTLAGLSEFLGGFLLALGFLTRGAAAAIGVTMFVAAFYVHAEAPYVCTSLPCQELALCFSAAALGLFLAGPGRLSADYLLIGRRGRKAPPPAAGGPPPLPPFTQGIAGPGGGARGASAAKAISSKADAEAGAAQGAAAGSAAGSASEGKPPSTTDGVKGRS